MIFNKKKRFTVNCTVNEDDNGYATIIFTCPSCNIESLSQILSLNPDDELPMYIVECKNCGKRFKVTRYYK